MEGTEPMRPKQFTITSIEPTDAAGVLLRFADGEQFSLNLAEVIEQHPALMRLKVPEVFSSVKVGDHGASVVWANDDDLELAADNLRARAVEQAGGVSHEFIWTWMARNNLTLDTAAAALGISRRMLAYYRSGAKPVPRTVVLACIGWTNVMNAASDERFALAA
ncbi:MAG: hypothetical protein CVU22_07485 [Betaproteobacteria bacterium HGW-Betaproteobacteria-16]|nr:MAG: hypothetical protein CVU22_07485 [Betaproteobacteria bacterium HGW-Betaproteobacteria-16]